MIYFVEDDSSIRELVCYSLRSTGFSAEGFEKPSDLWNAMENETPELVMLDIMLPEEDGISILSRLRSKESAYSEIPVIILTAKGTEYDKVMALDKGADDYITKPFGVLELIARVKAVLRRSGHATDEEKIYRHGRLSVSVNRHKVKIDDDDIVLTLKEFELLCILLENRGMVLNRDTILRRIWGYEFDGENRTVDVHIRTLRSKLGECGDIIETVRGIGYKISED